MNLKEECPHGGCSNENQNAYYPTVAVDGGGGDYCGQQQWHYNPSFEPPQRVLVYDSLENNYNIHSADDNCLLPAILGGIYLFVKWF